MTSSTSRKLPKSQDQLREDAFSAADTLASRAREYCASTQATLDAARESFEQALEKSGDDPSSYHLACMTLSKAFNQHKDATAALRSANETRQLMVQCQLRWKR